jgi:hypothetical protein
MVRWQTVLLERRTLAAAAAAHVLGLLVLVVLVW